LNKHFRYSLIAAAVLTALGGLGYRFTGQGALLASPALLLGVLLFLLLMLRSGAGWGGSLFFAGLALATAAAGYFLAFYTRVLPQYWHLGFLAGAAMLVVPLLTEYVVLRIAENHPLGAVARITYYEALLQPFTLIVLGVFAAVIFFYAFVPFYTFDEDHKMFRDTSTAFVLLAALVIMVYSAAKVIDEEIENRTMLTLMSKPIARWQVVVGKYLGIMVVIFVVITVLGLFTAMASFLRYYDDMRVDFSVANGNQAEIFNLVWQNDKATLALLPLFTLEFLEVATLAAIAVAISTRWSLAFNVVCIAVLYVGANLTRFIADADLSQSNIAWLFDVAFALPALALFWLWQRSIPRRLAAATGLLVLAGLIHLAAPHFGWVFNAKPLAELASQVLPSLSNFDLGQRLVYGTFRVGHETVTDPRLPTFGYIWQYVGLVALYGALYIGAGLALATALFRTRELT